MCYYTLLETKKERLEKAFNAEFIGGVQYEPANSIVSGFDHPKVPIIMNDHPNIIRLIRWGLLPSWVNIEQAKAIQNKTLNARGETISDLPSFRDSVYRRCIILVDGFFEWQHTSSGKLKHLIKLKDGKPFALGGIWSVWHNPLKPNSVVRTFSILTTEANQMMSVIHNSKKRMPLIIPREHYNEWLTQEPKDLNHLIKPFDDKLMVAEIVS